METFVVRVWSEPARQEPHRLHGVVDHVASGESTSFASAEQLLAFLHKPSRSGEEIAEGGGSS
jgi:hypothetical protein